MNVKLPAAIPQIPVSDLSAACVYYRDALGFTVDWSDHEIGLAGISRGDCRIFLANEPFRSGHGNTGPALTWLNLDSMAEVDALHRSWRDNGARIITIPHSKPWGLHEFTATDIDNNLFRVFHDFATPSRDNDE